MKSVVTWGAILLILFSSAVAAYAGYRLAGHPDGKVVGLTIDLLENTPFNNFKVPGILFFVTITIPGLVTIVLILLQLEYHTKFIILTGIILVMWVFLLMAFSPEVTPVQYVLLFAGIGQVLCGLWLDNQLNPEE